MTYISLLKNIYIHVSIVVFSKNSKNIIFFFITISLTYKYRKYCFGSNFRSGDSDGFTCFEVPWIRETHFSKWSVCMCVCLCVYYQHNSKTKYSRNIKFGILHLYYMQMLLKTFHKDRTNSLCTRTCKIILLHCTLWTEFLVFLHI